MSIILFLFVLTVLIFVHELGHFSAAKIFGIRVDEFAIGFPPKIWGFTKGETKYSINLILFGGYVKIFGENPNEDSLNGLDKERSLVNAAKWKQLIVILAGVFMNIIFAWLLISIAFNMGLSSRIGEYKAETKDVSLIITSVLKNSPAEIAGIKAGDKIRSVIYKGEKKENPTLVDVEKIIYNSSEKITFEYERGNDKYFADILAKEGVVQGKKAIGISMDMIGKVKFSLGESFYEGAKFVAIQTKEITIGIFKFFKNIISGKDGVFKDVAGPVGIASMIGEAKNIGASFLLLFISIISINLAVLNFIPFPALDGGRALFVIIEMLIRRRIKPAILNWINMIGFSLLMILMLLITYKDILRILG